MATYRIGSELREGDTIAVWWLPRSATIVTLRPYDGPHADHYPRGAQSAAFGTDAPGMTIDNDQFYQLIARSGR